jgi:biopolymer transport protein ExbB
MISSIILQITGTDSLSHVPQVVAAKHASLSLLDLLIKGGVIMIPIGVVSLIAVYIFLERYFAIRKASKEDTTFMNKIREYILSLKIDQAKALCEATNTPESRMIERGIGRIGKSIGEVERTLESGGKFEITKLEKNLRILGIVAGIAPMLGFIGTIMGVIKIFYNISLADNISIGIIAGGLYEKMITSASGLIIGILAYSGYHYLNILLDKVIFKMENIGLEFIDLLQKEA